MGPINYKQLHLYTVHIRPLVSILYQALLMGGIFNNFALVTASAGRKWERSDICIEPVSFELFRFKTPEATAKH